MKGECAANFVRSPFPREPDPARWEAIMRLACADLSRSQTDEQAENDEETSPQWAERIVRLADELREAARTIKLKGEGEAD